MMPAAKHGDPQLGVDIHLCVVPPSPSVPLPTPHISVVFDPFDYVPILGATVTVCGMKCATAGTGGMSVHIPPGFPFAPKLPDTDDELFMGSSTVVADGNPFSFISVPVLSCQVAGMISPPRLRPKGPPNMMMLPTTFNLAIPTNVFVGGPPTISLMGMAFKGAFAALGKFAKSGVFKRIRQRVFKNLKPGFLKCTVLRAEPVNILTGDTSVEQQDFSLPGRIPIEWIRSHSSGSPRQGLCGHGWETTADTRLEVDPTDGSAWMLHPSIGPLFFARLPADGDAPELELMDGALLTDHGQEYQVRTKEDRVYHFPKSLGRANEQGAAEYPIARISDLCGNWLDFQRHANQLVITESTGRCIAMSMQDGRVTEVALRVPDSNERQVFVRYGYDVAGDLVAVIDAHGLRYRFAYDDHHLVSHTDRNGLSFYYEYDKAIADQWRVIHAWGDGGLYDYRFEYLDALKERRITDSLGNVSLVKLDERGLPVSEIDALGGTTIYEYDEAARTTAVVDPAGNRTEYEYDERGNLLKLTRPDGAAILSEFDTNSKATAITDPNGALWQQQWDANGLLTQQVSPLAAESRYQYDARGQLVNFTNPRGAQTKLSFDALGNLVRLTDALDHATEFAYDTLGNVTAKTDPLGQRTHYRYDPKGRLTEAVLPSGATIACAYDAEDNLVSYRDENGAVTRLEYFGLGEIKRRIQPDGNTVEYHYDTEERLIGVTNQRGEHYQLKRDPLGRIVEEVDYWGQARRYEYTAAGHLQQSADPLGRVIQYQTDPLGRILKKVLPDPTDPEAQQTETFEYDPNGNLTACENPAIRIERGFDAEGCLLEERQGDACRVTNAYDETGNRVTRATERELAGGKTTTTVEYRYDALDQVTEVAIPGHDPLTFHRNALGQVTEEHLSGHVQRRLAYSPDGYLTAQQVQAAEGPVIEQRYRYDPAGNLQEKQDSAWGVDRYTYDPLGRITAHLNPEGKVKHYLNDPAGDRLTTRLIPASPEQHGDAEWRREGSYEGTYYRFDRAGNLTRREGQDNSTELGWDANQRLIASITNGQRTTYQYDPLGRRISKQTGDVVTQFCWDGDALLGDAQIIAPEDGARNLRRLREWIYYPETFEPLALLQDPNRSTDTLYLYHNDPNGCPTRLLDAKGQVVWAAQYSAWGAVERLPVNRVDNPIRLQGQYEDGETGLYYNRYRYYEPRVGQFIGCDPLGVMTGENPYQFLQNVLTWIDPLGLSCSPVIDPREIAGKSPVEIDKLARDKGLIPKGPDPMSGKGAYIDPVTNKQRVLIHPESNSGPHCHVNNPAGERLDINGNVVPPESSPAHLPLNYP